MADKVPPAPPGVSDAAPAMTTAVVVSNYLVALGDAPGIHSGAVVPNTPENAKALEGKSRPASEIDLGVAGIIRKD
ncbi:MAG: hypothetical protein FJX45_10440 [Alphaproteobacteria bacterium]|nr:hypothetical protein [Alphaproteobacteria bacterium]